MKIQFFKLKDWEREYFESHKELADLGLDMRFVDEPLDNDHIPAETDAEIVSIFVNSTIDTDVIEKLPKLAFVAARSTGFDHIDLKAASARNILVSNVPSYGENTVAEHAFALLLSLSHRIYEAYHRVREEGSFNLEGLTGFDLKGKTLGVIGTGRIGKHTIRIAKGFEMRVVAFDVFPNEAMAKELGFEYKSLDEVLAQSDIVSIHVPYLKETHHLLNAQNILKMKKGAYLINTSRGAVVETEALTKALLQGHLGGAGLDVLEEEGPTKDEFSFLASGHQEEHNLKTILQNHALIDLPNVIITPHNAFNTTEAIKRIFDTTAENIRGFVKGKPVNIVNKSS